jgi:hypothetical protein
MFQLRDKMNIKKQIIELIERNKDFAFSSSASTQREEFKRLAIKFLSAGPYEESEKHARSLMDFILHQHEKNCVVGPVLESLNNFELYGKYEYKKQRLHFIHLANVFLLGLYLYHTVSIIKSKIDHEMESTTSEQEIVVDCWRENWRYSGGSEFGEFLYRWRLASLSHDIGYGVSLTRNDKTKIGEYLKGLVSDINVLEDLWHSKSKDLRDQLDSSIPEVSLKDYMDYQYENPFKDVVHYDHGLISSLILLRLMNEEYAKHEKNQVTHVNSTDIIWHESFLSGSILQAAIAIALHNLDQDEDALQQAGTNRCIFDLEKRPLAWLLKIADILQEWDRPMAAGGIMAGRIEPVKTQISNRIIVKDFPGNKLNNAVETIRKYTNPPDLIRFE